MADLSDAELSEQIYDLTQKHWTCGDELAVAVRTLVTAEILATAKLDEDAMVEAMARRLARKAECSCTSEPTCGEEFISCGWCKDAAADAFGTIKPELTRLAAENARMREALSWYEEQAGAAMTDLDSYRAEAEAMRDG